jgi:hypothetical protein
MTTSVIIKARFDGNTLIPEEQVDLPLNETLILEVRPKWMDARTPDPEKASEVWEQYLKRVEAREGANLSDEVMRRENIYEERV